MQSQQTIVNKSVKFTFEEQIRRFTLTPENQSLDQLVQMIRSLIHKDEVTLVIKYLDDENEWVTIDRDIEFQTALAMTEGVLRLSVSLGAEIQEIEQVTEVPVKERAARGRGRGRGGRGGKGGCGRGRKFKNEATEDTVDCETAPEKSDEAAPEPVWRKYQRRGKDQGKFKGKKGKGGRKFNEETTSDSVDPSLTVEELKAKIQKLVEYQDVVRNNLKEASEKLIAKKTEIVQMRQNPEHTGEQLDALKSEMAELKTAKLDVRGSLISTKRELGQLRQAVRAKKAETSETPSDV